MGEKFIFVGWARGNFETEQRSKREYNNIYVISPVSAYQSEDYQACGFKAEKKSCVSSEVWKDIDPGEEVELFFDSKGKVTLMTSTGKSIQLLAQ